MEETNQKLLKVIAHYRENNSGFAYTIVRGRERYGFKRSHPDEELFFDAVEKVTLGGVEAAYNDSIVCVRHENGAAGASVDRQPEDIYPTRSAAIAAHRLEVLKHVAIANRRIADCSEYVRRLCIYGEELDGPPRPQPPNARGNRIAPTGEQDE